MAIYLGYTTQNGWTFNYYLDNRVKTKEGALADLICWSVNSAGYPVRNRGLHFGVCLPKKSLSNNLFNYLDNNLTGYILRNNSSIFSRQKIVNGTDFRTSPDGKYVLMELDMPTNSGSGSFNLGFLPPYEGMNYYVTFVGDTSESTFWNNAINHSSVIYPWSESTSGKGGGTGNWDDNQTDPISLPDLTTLNTQSFANTLFVSTYRLTNSEVQALGREFWKSTFIEQIIQKFENPMDSIISLSMIPVDSVGSAKEIIIGGYRTGISSHLIGNQFVNLSCGSVSIPEKWGGAIDYHSGISVYLPFIGVEQLDPQECIGATIAINYYIDIITGACIAFVKITRGELNSILYHFTGNCSYSLPLTKQDYTAIFNAIVGASATAIGTVASGGSGIMASVAIGSNMLTSAETHTAHSGSMGGNTGIMGVKKPYIILSRPVQSLPADFGKFRGFPSNITDTLSNLNGFTKVKEIHLENIGATDAEKSEIEQLLKSGVIIK